VIEKKEEGGGGSGRRAVGQELGTPPGSYHLDSGVKSRRYLSFGVTTRESGIGVEFRSDTGVR